MYKNKTNKINVYDLPPDIQEKLLKRIKLKGLPRIQKKMLHKDAIKTADEAIKKLNQICSYSAYNEESRKAKFKKLTDIYLKWILLNNSNVSKKPYTSFIGPDKIDLLKSIFEELNKYWNKKNLSNYLCYIIKSIDFESNYNRGSRLTPTRIPITSPSYILAEVIKMNYENKDMPDNTINIILDYVHPNLRNNMKRNLKNPDYFYENFTSIILNMTEPSNNNEIHELFCSLINSIIINDINNEDTEHLLTQFSYLNGHGYIKKEVIYNIVLDTVSNNSVKICNFLYSTFQEWLTYYDEYYAYGYDNMHD